MAVGLAFSAIGSAASAASVTEYTSLSSFESALNGSYLQVTDWGTA